LLWPLLARASGATGGLPGADAPFLPDWARAFIVWMLQPLVLAVLLGVSVLLFVLGLVGVPLVLIRMPADFFSRPERRRLSLGDRRWPFWFVVLRGLKNLLGLLLVVMGLVMLLLPGPGLLTLFVALFLVDFPGKRRLQRWVVFRPAIQRTINAVRRRASRPPLERPAPG
jgi:hypothetical protein